MKMKRLGYVLSVVAVALLLVVGVAVTALAGNVTYENGVWTGLDSTKSYEYATATLNSDGSALTAGEYSALDTSAALGGGLWFVKATDEETPVLVYSQGNNLKNLWVESSEGTLAVEDSDGLGSVTFVEGAWTSPSLASTRNTSKGGYALATTNVILTTSGYIPADVVRNGVYSIDHFVNENGVKFYDLVKSLNFAYQYTPDQVIPMAYFDTFTFDSGKIDGQYKVNTGTTAYTVLDLYVVKEDGSVVVRRAQKATVLNHNWACQGTVSFTLSDFAETDGYIVGMAIYPYGAFSENAEIIHCQAGDATSYRTAPSHLLVDFTNAAYSVNVPLPEAAKPNLEMDAETGLVSGFETGVVYEYGSYGPNGVSAWTDVADTASFTAPAGLTAIRVKESDSFKASRPVLFYVKGSNIENLWVESASGTLAVDNSEGLNFVTFKEGTWTSPSLTSKHAQATSGYALATSAAVLSTGGFIPDGTERNGTYSIDYFVNADGVKFYDLVKSLNFAYQYKPDQIIPMSYFGTFTFDTGKYSGQFEVASGTTAYTVLELYVVKEDGSVVVRRAMQATQMNAQWASQGTVTFTLNDFAETDGYIVGMAIYPYGAFSENAQIIHRQASSTAIAATAFLLVDFTNASYTVDVPRPEAQAPVISLVNGKVSGLEAGTAYEYANVGPNGIGAWNDVADNANFAPVGLFVVRVADSDAFKASAPSNMLYVKGNSTGKLWTESSTGTLAVDDSDGLGVITFEEGKWTAPSLGSVRNTANGGYYLATTNHVLSSAGCIPDYMERNKDYAISEYGAFFDNVMAYSYAYQYTANQIIPMADFDTFTFNTGKVDGQFKVGAGTTAYTVLKLYVVKEDGSVVVRSAQKPATLNSNWACSGTVSFTLSDFAETDGYIVGMVIHPYGAFSENAYITFCTAGANTARANPAHLLVDFTNAVYSKKVSIDNVTVNGNFLEGLEEGGNYILTPVTSIAQKGGSLVYGTAVADPTAELPAGLYTIQTATGTDKKFLFVKGTVEQQRTLGVYTVDEQGTKLQNQRPSGGAPNTDFRNPGTWNIGAGGGPKVADPDGDGIFTSLTHNGGGNSFATNTTALYNALQALEKATTSADKAAALATIEAEQKTLQGAWNASKVQYAFLPEEMIDINDVYSYSYAVAFGGLRATTYEGTVNSIFKAYVADDEGAITAYTWTSAGVPFGSFGTVQGDPYVQHTVDFTDATGWDVLPTDGYLVGIEIYPYYLADHKLIGARPASGLTNNVIEVDVDPEGYIIKGVEKVDAQDPVLDTAWGSYASANGYIIIKSAQLGVQYEWRYADSEEWTAINGNVFKIDEPDANFEVRAVANEGYNAAANTVTGQASSMIVKGQQIVLNEQVAIKLYIDAPNAGATPWGYTFFAVPSDGAQVTNKYPTSTQDFYWCQGTQTTTSGQNRATYDPETGLYTLTINIDPKDLDTAYVRLHSFKRGNVTISSAADIYIYARNLIADYKAYDDAEVAALAEEIELYGDYAENYFDSTAAALTAPEIDENALLEYAKPSRTSGDLPAGVEFAGTSLIVEGQVKIRHYFSIEEDADLSKLTAGYTQTTDKDGNPVIYYDSKALLVSEFDDQQQLTVVEGYTINYSVINYIQSAYINAGEADAKLKNLAMQMFNYYKKATSYAE